MTAFGGQAKAVAPFWTRIPSFFAYPFYPSALTLMVITIILAFGIWQLGLIIGLIGFLFLAAVFIKYCIECLDHAADGELKPPPLSSETLTEGLGVAVKFIGVMVMYQVVGGIFYRLFGEVGSIVGSLLLLALQNASIMVLGATRSFTDAINPIFLIAFIHRIGWSYLLLYVFQLLFGISVVTVIVLLAPVVGPIAAVPLIIFAVLYFWILTYALMGYVMYQRHEALGYDVGGDDEDEGGPNLRAFERFMADGNPEAAREELRDQLRQHPEDLELHRRYHRAAKLTDAPDKLCGHGLEFIELLMRQNKIKEATDIYLDCVAAKPDFRPDRPEVYLPMVKLLQETGRGKQAVQLANGFHKRFPGNALVVPPYFTTAQIFHDRLGRDDQAAKVLQFIKTNYPNHEMATEVDYFLRVLGG